MTHTTAYKDATLKIAGSAGKAEVPCEIDLLEGKRLRIVAHEGVKAYTPVSVEYNDALILGEVVTCAPEAGGLTCIEIKVEQILSGLQSLMNLRANLLGEPAPFASQYQQAHACAVR